MQRVLYFNPNGAILSVFCVRQPAIFIPEPANLISCTIPRHCLKIKTMKKGLLLLSFFICCVFNLRAGDKPIGSLSGTYLVGNSQPTYKKLTDVASILNNTGFTVVGNVVFELDSDYDGTTGETFPITFNQFNVSGGNWTVTIRPKAGVGMRTTSGNPGTPSLITLNGTDRIIFDGRAGGTGGINWLIRNTATTNAGAAVLLQNDAQNNILTYLQLEGQTVNAGIVYLGSTTGVQGNDNNTISYCRIRDRTDLPTPTRPTAGIFSFNCPATSGTSIHDNNLFNIYTTIGSSYGIYLASGTTAASVVHNSIYQARTLTTSVSQSYFYGIYIAEQEITQVVVNDNFIGGSAPECGGEPLTISSPGSNFCSLTGIYMGPSTAGGGVNVCNNNTIRNIAITAASPGNFIIPVFDGIRVEGSRLDVTNNTIGSTEAHDDIKITINGGGYFTSRMIYITAPTGGAITGNKIGGITIDGGTTTNGNDFACIYVYYNSNGTTQPLAVNNNVIGSATITDNIRSVSASLPLSFLGIGVTTPVNVPGECKNNTVAGIALNYTGTIVPAIRGIQWNNAAVTIDSNLVSDISSAALGLSTASGTLQEPLFKFHGILCLRAKAIVSNNTVRGLRLTNTTPVNTAGIQNTNICGIAMMDNDTTIINNNKVYDLTSANNLGSSAATLVAGMDISFLGSQVETIYNNLISLDNGANTNNCEIRGIRIRPSATGEPAVKLYHNTIYAGGNNGTASNTATSYLVSRSINYTTDAGTPAPLLRNNLLVNGRTGGSGGHYIFRNTISTPTAGWTTTTSDSNVLVTADVTKIGRWGSSDLDSTQWKTTGGDAHSWFYTVSQIAPADLFADPAAGDLGIKAASRRYVTGKGTGSTGIITDYAGETRSTTAPTIGAYEYFVVPNAAPVITSHGGNAAVTLPVPENTTAVTTVTATDANAGTTLVYSLAGGEDAAKFTINSSTGELSFITAPDFEQPGDATGDNVYIVTVEVSDGESTATQRFKIRIIDANDHAPVITSYSGNTGVNLQVPENTMTVIATVTATDADKNATITYSLVNEEDAARFTVNSPAGELKFITPPDFERPGDTNGDNVYIVTVKASDGDSSATQRFKIRVTNENDNTPVITSHNGDAMVAVQVAEGTIIVDTVSAADGDSPAITYSIVNENDGAVFSVSSAGVLSFITAPDYEHPGDSNHDNVYLVTVKASDGILSAVQQFSISVTDLNDNFPTATMTVRIPENTVEVTPLEGTDDDAGSTVTFTMVDNEDGSLFWLNPATGSLEFKTAPDFEQPYDADHDNTYLVSVKMIAGEMITILRFKVKVTDADESGGTGRMTGRNSTEPEVQSTVVLQMETAAEPGRGIKAYPNPVTGKRFTLRMESIAAGKYTLDLYTTTGQLVCRQQLNHTGKSVIYPIQLPANLTRGMYIMKLTGADTAYTERLIVD
jgi:hypothetical protein